MKLKSFAIWHSHGNFSASFTFASCMPLRNKKLCHLCVCRWEESRKFAIQTRAVANESRERKFWQIPSNDIANNMFSFMKISVCSHLWCFCECYAICELKGWKSMNFFKFYGWIKKI
jgi:hypothetical protein